MQKAVASLSPALTLVLTLALAGCVYESAPPVEGPFPPEEVPDACRASGLQGLVGQPESVLATMRFSQTLRVIQPGMAVTTDYSPFRLNILIGRTGLIDRVYCG